MEAVAGATSTQRYKQRQDVEFGMNRTRSIRAAATHYNKLPVRYEASLHDAAVGVGSASA
jgi:hypothetical protein